MHCINGRKIHQDNEFEQESSMVAASSTTKRRVVRRRPSSRHNLIRIMSLVMLSIALILISRSFSSPKDAMRQSRKDGHLRGGQAWVHSDSQLFVSSTVFYSPSSMNYIQTHFSFNQNEQSIASAATHLIIVAGHSVLISGAVQNAPYDESVWYLLPYQRNKGLPHAIVSHIQAGINLALKDEESLLVFSGGETRAVTGPDTEGASYFRVADALQLWDGRDVFADENNNVAAMGIRGGDVGPNTPQSTVRSRTITEEYATDSFENLMFSICRFHDITGSYPQKITMVSFTFKQNRFETLHANALQWPIERFDYVGVDPPSYTGFDLQEASEGEQQNSLVPFQSDPYGCHTEVLQQKRRERNPFKRVAPYELTCPDMKELLKWCGPSLIPKEKVPWSNF